MVVVVEQDQCGGDDLADPPGAAAVAAQHLKLVLSSELARSPRQRRAPWTALYVC
jgi:hypothetical protein